MKGIPEFWVSQEGEGASPSGKPLRLQVWGWSRESMTEAAEVARERLRLTLERLRTGGPRPDEYYPRMALREQVLRQLHDDDTLVAEVSRNRYGAEVLNTDVVLIADVDFPQQPQPSVLGRLFGRGKAETTDHEGAALRRIGESAGQHPVYGTHVYRTFGGLRVIVTGSGALPDSALATELMAEMGTDEVYVQLCATHATYRARLSPKPWRIGHQALRAVWPFRDEHDEQRTQRWVQEYDRKSAGHATCRRMGSFGAEASPVEREVIDLHDQASRADEDLPLA